MRLVGQNQYIFLIDGTDNINQLHWYFSHTTAGPPGPAAAGPAAAGSAAALAVGKYRQFAGLKIREIKKSGKKAAIV